MPERRDSFVRGTLVIGTLTFLSRILGLARDVLCAAAFGISPAWDAFLLAFRIPNLFRRLLGEGALSAAFIPVFTEALEQQPREEAERLAGRVAACLAAVLLGLLIAGEVAVLSLPRLTELSPRWRLALGFTAVLLPYMVFICLTALAGAMLNSLRHFAAPAFAPVLLNVCWIAAVALGAVWITDDTAQRLYVVAAAVLLAGVLQLGVQLWALRRKGFRWRLSLDARHRDVRRIVAAMLPVIVGLAAFQINVLLDGFIAVALSRPEGRSSFELFGVQLPYPMEAGANSVLYYANRLAQFPLAVFGIALATAVFPSLSGHAARADWDELGRTVSKGLRLVLFVTVPACAGLILLREPIIRLIYERGHFLTDGGTARTEAALLVYSAGIWAYSAQHVLARAFYSINRHATPARVAGVCVILNLALNLTLVWPLAEVGLASATAICAAVQVVALFVLLERRVRVAEKAELARTAGRALLATAVMAAACYGVLAVLPSAGETRIVWKALRVIAPVTAGVAVYGAVSAALGAREAKLLLAALRRRS